MVKDNKGFTIVELLAVIVIIGLLLVITVPQIQNISKKSKIKMCKTKLDLIENNLNMYLTSNPDEFSKLCGGKETCDITVSKVADLGLVDYNSDSIVQNPLNNKSLNLEKINIKHNSNGTYIVSFNNYAGICGGSSGIVEGDTDNNSFYDVYYVLDNGEPIYYGFKYNALSELENICTGVNFENKENYNYIRNESSSIDGINKFYCYYSFNTSNNKTKLYDYIFSLKNTNLIQTSDYNIRYVGSNPNNYVLIGSELWRIIGLFNNNESSVVKVIKAVDNNKLLWDSNGSNDWENSSLKSYLSDNYNNNLYLKQYAYFALWYTGGYNPYYEQDVFVLQNWENEIITDGYVGLMSASDFVFAANNSSCANKISSSTCINNNWLYYSFDEWVINYDSSDSSYVMYVAKGTGLSRTYSNANSYIARPVIYLKPDVLFESGDGTSDSPYKISI